MGRVRHNVQLKALKRQCAVLQKQLSSLVASRANLESQLQLRNDLCHSFGLLQVLAHAQTADDDADAHPECGDGELLSHLQSHLQSQLLQQLAQTPADPQHFGSPRVADNRIAKSHQLELLDDLVAHAFTQQQQDASVTAEQLAGLLRTAVLEGGLHLQLQQAGSSTRTELGQHLQQLWLKFFQAAVAALMAGRPQVLAEVTLYDLSKMQPDAQAVASATPKAAAIVPQLGLSQSQLLDIAAGNTVFANLLSQLLLQHQQLQADADSINTTYTINNSSGSTSSSSGDVNSGFSSESGTSLLHTTLEHLEHHTHETRRRRVLLQKEWTLKSAACLWFVGCLSWEQLTRAYVLSWPHPLRLPVLMHEIASYYAAQQ